MYLSEIAHVLFCFAVLSFAIPMVLPRQMGTLRSVAQTGYVAALAFFLLGFTAFTKNEYPTLFGGLIALALFFIIFGEKMGKLEDKRGGYARVAGWMAGIAFLILAAYQQVIPCAVTLGLAGMILALGFLIYCPSAPWPAGPISLGFGLGSLVAAAGVGTLPFNALIGWDMFCGGGILAGIFLIFCGKRMGNIEGAPYAPPLGIIFCLAGGIGIHLSVPVSTFLRAFLG